MTANKTGKRAAQKSRVKNVSGLRAAGTQEASLVYLVSLSARKFPAARSAPGLAYRRVSTNRAIREEFRAAKGQSVWIAGESGSMAALAGEPPAGTGDRRLLVLDETEEITHQLYSAYFRYVVTASDSLKLLPNEELAEVLVSPNREELFIGGAYDQTGDAVLLYRGNVEPLVVPRAWFANQNSKAKVNVRALEVTDYGQTVRLGEFEASADSILYEFDATYRRSAKKRALEKDNSLGASIRRLRLQRGLSREDFDGLTAKAIARIERNEVSRPHNSTLSIIAKTLGVSVAALETY